VSVSLPCLVLLREAPALHQWILFLPFSWHLTIS
jgi:hypothetical protein